MKLSKWTNKETSLASYNLGVDKTEIEIVSQPHQKSLNLMSVCQWFGDYYTSFNQSYGATFFFARIISSVHVICKFGNCKYHTLTRFCIVKMTSRTKSNQSGSHAVYQSYKFFLGKNSPRTFLLT